MLYNLYLHSKKIKRTIRTLFLPLCPTVCNSMYLPCFEFLFHFHFSRSIDLHSFHPSISTNMYFDTCLAMAAPDGKARALILENIILTKGLLRKNIVADVTWVQVTHTHIYAANARKLADIVYAKDKRRRVWSLSYFNHICLWCLTHLYSFTSNRAWGTSRTSGYLARDLADLVERALQQVLREKFKNQMSTHWKEIC